MMHLDDSKWHTPMLYFMGLNDDKYCDFPFTPLSVIIDPWGMIEEAPLGCKVVRPGRKPRVLCG